MVFQDTAEWQTEPALTITENWLNAGKLAATVSQGTEDQGRLSADACADLLEGKSVDAETIVENVTYTTENAQEALDALK